jgi:hypothetical protein
MRGGRWWLLVILAAATPPGCFWVRKPYADDPLVRRRPAPKSDAITQPNVEPIPRPLPPNHSRISGAD